MDVPVDRGETKPLTHKDARLVVWGVLLPLFLGSLDNTILASALPTIGRDLGDVHNLPWLITAYLLAATAGMPLYGKFADIHGRRFTLQIAIFFYLAGSLICALSPSVPVLILGRAVQGIGGSGLSSVSVMVLGDIAAPKDRGKYYAYYSIAYTTAGACGPAFGGFLAESLHWTAIFWINIPLGLIALLVTSTVLHRLPRHERPHRLDLLGALLIVSASMSFMLALNLGGVRIAWTSLPILTLFAAALIMACLFVRRLLTAPEPLIPIAILTDPIVRWAVVANALGWGSIVGLNIFLPMYLQSAIGLSPTTAGLSLMVLMMTLNLSAGAGGQVLGRVKHYKVLPMVGMVVAIGALTVLAWQAHNLTLWSFELLLFLIGLGFGPMPSLCAVAMQNAVARHQLGISVATMNFSRNLVSTILVAAFGAIVLGGATSLEPGALGPGRFGGAIDPGAGDAAEAFSRVFYAAAACLVISLIALMLIEERPLRTDAADEAK